MKTTTTEITFLNNKKEKLHGYIHTPTKIISKYEKIAYVHLHGFPGDCEGTAKLFCEDFAKKGIISMRFDFSGSNQSEGDFEDKLLSQELKDIQYAINYLQKTHKQIKKVILLGHSTGAILAPLYAQKDKRISLLVISAGVHDLKNAAHYDFPDYKVKQFWEQGYIEYNERPDSWCYNVKLKKAYYDEFFTLDIPKAQKKIKIPTLIVHGEKDTAIPAIREPYKIYEQANEPKKLKIFKNMDHSYTDKTRKATVKLILQMVKKY